MALKGKVALITGGARGIGASAVRLFCQAGARVAFNYRTAKDRAESLASECGGGSVCRAFAKDLDSAEAGRALVQDTVAAFGRIDCLVVNHGIWPPDDAPIATMDERQWRRTMDVNLDSVFGLVQAAVAAMQRQAASKGEVRGHVVLVSSTAGQREMPRRAGRPSSSPAQCALAPLLWTQLAAAWQPPPPAPARRHCPGLRPWCAATAAHPWWRSAHRPAARCRGSPPGNRSARRPRRCAEPARVPPRPSPSPSRRLGRRTHRHTRWPGSLHGPWRSDS